MRAALLWWNRIKLKLLFNHGLEFIGGNGHGYKKFEMDKGTKRLCRKER